MDWGGGAGANLAALVEQGGRARAATTEAIGRARAQQIANSGQVWGHSLADLGQLIAQAPQRQLQQQEIKARTAELQGLADERGLKVQDQQRQQAGRQALMQVLGDSSVYDPNTGEPDDGAIQVRLQQAGFPEQAQSYAAAAKTRQDLSKQDREASDARKKAQQATDDYIADVIKASPNADAFHATIAQAVKTNNDPQLAQAADKWSPIVDSWGDQYQQNAQQVYALSTQGRAAAATRAAEAAKPYTLNAGDVRVTPGVNGQPDTRESAPFRPTAATPPQTGSFPDFVTRKYGANPTDAQILEARKLYGQADDRPTVSVTTQNTDQANVAETVKGMADGSLPPILPGRATKEYIMLTAEAHRQGYDLSKAATDWAATQKHIATLNGSQQTRLNQSINALPDLLDSVDSLASQWKGSGFPLLNKANMALAKNGAFGSKVASLANQLDSQIADVVADLGNVYMGGNSPTDSALDLSRKSLSADWSEKVLHDMVKLAKGNVQIRKNSIANTGVQGASVDNPYGSQPPAPAAAPSGVIYARDPQGGRHQATAGTPLPPGWKLEQ